ncbi:MAG: hypothetical protein K2Y27_28490 [Xanthobacteraceae bacterium]|nr:hypothetical protein [Xanthobacteraceae bacterium]
MQSAFVMLVYILTAIVVQAIGFGISQIIAVQWPQASLLTFLMIFMAAFGVAWPIAVRIGEWGIRKAGYEVDTAASNLPETVVRVPAGKRGGQAEAAAKAEAA